MNIKLVRHRQGKRKRMINLLQENIEKINAEIIGFCNELSIIPPFKVVD